MHSRRIARQATNWKTGRCPGQLRTDWQQTFKVDIRGGGISQEQIPVQVVERGTTLCATSTGATKVRWPGHM